MNPLLRGVLSAVGLSLCPILAFVCMHGVQFNHPTQSMFTFIAFMYVWFKVFDEIMMKIFDRKERERWD